MACLEISEIVKKECVYPIKEECIINPPPLHPSTTTRIKEEDYQFSVPKEEDCLIVNQKLPEKKFSPLEIYKLLSESTLL